MPEPDDGKFDDANADQSPAESPADDPTEAEVFVAELASDDEVVLAEYADDTVATDESDSINRRVTAKGGAIGGLTLGVLAFAGSLLTSWAAINGVIGVLLAAYGISSVTHRRQALVGMLLSVVGIAICVFRGG